jgi:hypothetical protein
MRLLITIAVTLATVGAAQAQGSNPAALEKLRQIFKQEPQIKDVQRSALRYYKLEPETISGMASAARWKGIVPEVEGGLENAVHNNFNNTRDGLYPILPSPAENPNPFNFKERSVGGQDHVSWHVRAVWNLDRLVFNAEALDVRSLNSLAENLVREVTSVYFQRRRVLINIILNTPEDQTELLYELMRLDELTATLDSLTGGTFAKQAWNWEAEAK